MSGTSTAGDGRTGTDSTVAGMAVQRVRLQGTGTDALVFDVAVDGPPDGAPVLLLHGFPQDHRSWAPVAARLHSSGLRTVAPTQRGYSPGARPEGVDAYAMPALVADALGVLDALDLPYAHVVGHDWGAAVAWQLAARHAQRVTSLVAVSVGHPVAFSRALREDRDQQARSGYIREFGEQGTAEDVLLADDAARLRSLTAGAGLAAAVTTRAGLTAALNWYRAMAGSDYLDCPAVEVPTTFVWSNADDALGRTQALGTAAFVHAEYRFVELDGVSHWVPEQAPAALSAEIVLRAGSW